MQQAVPPTITTCVFDAYGTLFDIAAIADHARDALGDRADDLMELWRRKQLEYSWLRSLMGRHADFWHVTGDSLDFAMAALGLDDPLLRSRLMDGFFTPKLYPDVVDTLARLRTGGIRTAILSNGSPPMLTAAAKHSGLDLLMDAVISVEKVGIFKPHPSVYRLAVEQWDQPPTAISFQTANCWDAAGAAAFGLHVVWINRLGTRPDRLPAMPQVEVRSLRELPGLIGVG